MLIMLPGDKINASSIDKSYELFIRAVVDYAIFVLDPDGRVANWNIGAQRIKGYEEDEILGKHFSVFYSEGDRAAHIPELALATAAREGRYESEGWRLRKDGTRFMANAVIDAIRNEDGTLIGFVKVTRDITERLEAQARMQESRDRLLRAQKMEALGQLTGGMAHDFNNLLTAILGNAELASRHGGSDERLTRFLGNIMEAARRGAAVTGQLLSFARRQKLASERVDIRALLTGTENLIRHTLRGGSELKISLTEDLQRIDVDPVQLELALVNLCTNARDAMEDSGRIEIRAENVALHGEVEQLEGNFVVFHVIDTGRGIPEEILDRIVEPFFTTKGFGQGSGLGLSQVYGFAQQSGGAICFQSQLGKGTTASLYLPAGASDTASRGSNGETGRKRILVVEDDHMVADMGVELIGDMGHEATVVYSAQDALTVLQRDPQFDLVFSDIVMPGGMNGIELGRKIRKWRPEIPILLTTGFSEAASSRTVEFPLIPKPYSFQDLGSAFAMALALKDREPAC